MEQVVIVSAVRTPIGRRNGALSAIHPADLLGAVQREAVDRAGIDPTEVGQVIGGCVNAIGEQSYNIARTAWLAAGLPQSVAATTVDSQCGSGQQALNLAAALVAADVVEVAMACGVESMSRVPIGAATAAGPGVPLPDSYANSYESISQFEAAERIADSWGVSRVESDGLALRSQDLAARAWAEGRFDREVIAVEGAAGRVGRDEGLRQTSLEQLAALKPVVGERGIHTPGSSSQISDAASAVLLMSRARAESSGVRPRARISHQCLVGVDPVMKLTGPIEATQRILKLGGMSISDLEVIEVNEAFSAIVLAWERELHPDPKSVNPNGGAIALGHPLGAGGVRLVTTALHELERIDGSAALITMCCGGGLGTGTLLERI